MFKVNNKNTRITSKSLDLSPSKMVILLLTSNIFTPFSSVSIADFEN